MNEECCASKVAHKGVATPTDGFACLLDHHLIVRECHEDELLHCTLLMTDHLTIERILCNTPCTNHQHAMMSSFSFSFSVFCISCLLWLFLTFSFSHFFFFFFFCFSYVNQCTADCKLYIQAKHGIKPCSCDEWHCPTTCCRATMTSPRFHHGHIKVLAHFAW